MASLAHAQTSYRWFVIETADGKRIGHSRQSIEPRKEGGRLIQDVTRSVTQESKSPPRRMVDEMLRVEDDRGQIIKLVHTSRIGRAGNTTVVWINGSEAKTAHSGVGQSGQTIALPADIRFDNGAALLRSWSTSSQPMIEYSVFNIAGPHVEQVRIDQPAQLENGMMRARRQIFDGEDLRSVSWITLDGDGRIIRTESPMFGTFAITRPSTEADALAKHPPFSLVRNAMVKAPYRVPVSSMTAHIRYRFAFKEGVSFLAPHTGEQRSRVDEQALIVDICDKCGEQETRLSADEQKRFLASTKWMQSDHPTFVAIAAPIAKSRLSDREKMKLLSERVAQRLRSIDFAGHVTALEAWKRGRWDCTEEALILATLARAAGIPARVASGLVYSRELYHGVSNVFMPHAWTLAYIDGRWQSFDVSIGQFDSTHIAFALGDGDSRSMAAGSMLAGLTKMKAMVEVRKRAEAP
jgi:hypothetical protein